MSLRDGPERRRRQFGVELEFSITDSSGRPALGSAAKAIADGRELGLSIVSEQGSFQVELNPGPWELTPEGVNAGLAELDRQVQTLASLVEKNGHRLLACAIPPVLDEELLNHPDFMTDDDRYRAFARYFQHHSATLSFQDGTSLLFPGERAIACINEIHVHIAMESDSATELLFSDLNSRGEAFAARFLDRPIVNGKLPVELLPTLRLFEQANGEPSPDGRFNRVWFLPSQLKTKLDYDHAVQAFPRVPAFGRTEDLPPEGTVYFWVRLRGEGSAYRIEYRPIDMGADWAGRIRYFLGSLGLV